MDDIEVREFLAKEFSSFAIDLDDLEIDFATHILENIEQIVGNFSGTNHHHALNDLRSDIVVEENDLDPISRHENLVLGLQNKVSIWNREFVATLDRTNNDVSVFLPELGEAHIAEIAIWLDLKFHQGNTAVCKMLHRKGIWGSQ